MEPIQPGQDQPAEVQGPLVEQVVKVVQTVSPPKSNILIATIASYFLAILVAVLMIVIVRFAFGAPLPPGVPGTNADVWSNTIPLAIITAFFLGFILPILFARRRRIFAVFYTFLLLVITLVVLITLGLAQLRDFDVLKLQESLQFSTDISRHAQ